MVRFVVMSDPHEVDGRFGALVDYVNDSSKNIDAVFINGDFLNEHFEDEQGRKSTGYIGFLKERKFDYVNQEKLAKVRQLGHVVSIVENLLRESGGDKAKLAEEVVSMDKLEDKFKDTFLENIKNHENNISNFNKLNKEMEIEEKDNVKRGIKDGPRKLVQYMKDRIKVIDKKLAESNVPVYGVAGNNDPGLIYKEMKSVHFLEKEGSININGLRIAGNPSTWEMPKGLEALVEFYDHLDNSENHVKDENVESYLREKGVENIPVTKRLKDEKIDVLFLHKGVGGKMVNGNDYDPAAYKLVKDKNPITFCGHYHSSLITYVNGKLGIRSSPDIVYDVEIDPRTKKISWVDVLRVVKAA